jgi:hypothetical protein
VAVSEGLPVVPAFQLDIQTDEERWLIRSIWGKGAVGMIGGTPKSYKTWMGLEMAFSVATGLAFLGKFAVEHQGRALIYLAEDALPLVRARIESLCAHHGVDIRALDLHVITAPELRLDLANYQEKLRHTVERLRPHLILLDPLVRLHRLDENNASEMSGLLGYLRALQREHDVAVVLVHHVSKRARPQPGQALRGTSDLHAWTDCAAYLAWNNERLHLTLEHRAARPPEPMVLDLVSGPDVAGVHLEVRGDVATGQPSEKTPLMDRVISALRHAAKPMTRGELREGLKVNNERLGTTLADLRENGRVRQTPKGWTLPERQSESTDGDQGRLPQM